MSYLRKEKLGIAIRKFVTLRDYFLKKLFWDEIVMINVITTGQEEKLLAVEEFSLKKSQS